VNALVVFTRVPAPGRGKRRLRPVLGDALVDRLTVAMLLDICAWPWREHDAVILAHDGPAELLPLPVAEAHRVPQPDGSFGHRIACGFDAAFARGAERVVMVGSDCPTLPDRLLSAAMSELGGAGSTLVEADDGGWILLGLSRPLGDALSEVNWSATTTAAETAAALAADGRPPLVLGSWYDIDEPADLDRLRVDLDTDPSRAPRTAETLARLGTWAPA
jgi:glycosyltransferase A (GT-A) superfamily protein (DUF2064 family)